MPVTKVKDGWVAYSGSPTVHKSKKEAEEQLKAIKATQAKGFRRKK